MQILVQGQFSSLKINWLRYAIFRAWTLFRASQFGLSSKFREIARLSMYVKSVTKTFHEFFAIRNFLNFHLATTRKRMTLFCLGGLCKVHYMLETTTTKRRMRYDH